jgi:hypothetical protein
VSPALQSRTGTIWGLPVMKFTLTCDGRLPPSANKSKPKDAWRIRMGLHPQFVDLWKNHPALREVENNRHFPKTGGASLKQTHHLHGGPIQVTEWRSGPSPEILDLCEPIDKHGVLFRPLVRESFALHCGLRILFLRKEKSGKVFQGGDIDGRIKTLMDALAMPQHIEQIMQKSNIPKPIHCLLEDDSLVSGLQVETERLLDSNQDHPADYARLIIEVDVRTRLTTIYNQSFLG